MHPSAALGEARMSERGLKLDDRDMKILAILQREGRISKCELARRVNLSSSPCWARLQRLEEAGIIEGYGAKISLARFGPRTSAVVTVELDSHRGPDFDRFERYVAGVPGIHECLSVGGGIDYVIRVTTPDVESCQTLLEEMLAAGVGVKRYWTYFVMKEVKNAPPPLVLDARVPEVAP